MKSSYFQDAVESSAKVLGRKDVRVVFEGDRAETDGNTVYLPALPPSAEINIDQAEIVRGFRDHETMHVRCTATDAATLNMLETATKSNESLGKLIQYCEDIRIENAGVSEYAGMKSSLSAIQTHAAKMLIQQLEANGKPEEIITQVPRHIQLRLLLQAMGRDKIGVTSGGLFDVLTKAIGAADPALYQFADKMSDAMAALPTGYDGQTLVEAKSRKGTAESFKLANRIYTEFGELDQTPPPPPPPPPTEPGDGNGDGGGGDGDDGDDQDQESDQGSGDGQGSGGGKGKGKGSGSGGGSDQGQDDGQDDGQGGGNQDDQAGGDGGDGSGSGGGSQDDDDLDDDGDDVDQQGHQDGAGDTETGNGGGGHGNNGAAALGSDKIPDIDIDDLYSDALKDVVDQIAGTGDDKDELDTHGPRQKRFAVYSKRFNQKLHIMDFRAAKAGDRVVTPSVEARLINLGLRRCDHMDKELVGSKAMIRRLLELELQARSDRRWENGFKTGRLQSVRLVQAIQGRETVYQRRENGKDMDTLLFISLDGSGSMSSDGRMYESAKLAYALSEALERTGCDVAVQVWGNTLMPKESYKDSTYTTKEYQEAEREYINSDGHQKFSALGVLTRVVVKAKNQRTTDPRVRASFGLAIDDLNCSTPTHQSVFADLIDMGRERHAKKIYLHLTDGDADGLQGQLTSEEVMKEAHHFAESLGVHMIGVGIAGMNVSHLFSDSVNVRSSDAYEPVIKKLAKLVAKEAGHASGFRRSA